MKSLPALPRPLIERLLLPLAMSGLLAACFYFMIYNLSGQDLFGRSGEPLFLVGCLLVPGALTVAASFFLRDKTHLGIAAAAFLMASAWAGTWYQAHYGSLAIPPYYSEFEASGSFHLIFLFYTLFFLAGGYAFGFLSRAFDPPPPPDPVIATLGTVSKTKRRKKKRKKALLKKKDELGRFVEEVLEEEDDEPGDEGDEDDPADGEPAEGDAEPPAR